MFLKPWAAETVLFFAVLWQEDFRLGARTRGVTLPVAPAFQQFYYFNFGDFVNGFVNAFLIDGAWDVFLAWRRSRGGAPPASEPRAAVRAGTAAAASCAIIAVVEAVPTGFTTPDLADIPAGVLGAAVYLAARLVLLRLRDRAASRASRA